MGYVITFVLGAIFGFFIGILLAADHNKDNN